MISGKDLSAALLDVINLCGRDSRLDYDNAYISNLWNALTIPLWLPELPNGRKIEKAMLVIPENTPAENMHIRVSKDAVLRVPHVDSNQKVCLFEEDSSRIGISPFDALSTLLDQFFEVFIPQWIAAELDDDFYKEPENYWDTNINFSPSNLPHQIERRKVWLLDSREKRSRRYKGVILDRLGGTVIIVGTASEYREKILHSLGGTHRNIDVLEVSLNCCFTPSNWPRNIQDLRRVVNANAPDSVMRNFWQKITNRKWKRLVVLRATNCNYGYLIEGKNLETAVLTALPCDRMDPNWTFGRDTDSNINKLQKSSIVVFGAGALGSQVVLLLAKAGIGKIVLVDYDILSAANIGRHALGVTSIGQSKVARLANLITKELPSCNIVPIKSSAEKWLSRKDALKDFNLVLDLTGEAGVRASIDNARTIHDVPVITGWMEPFVVAAHVVTFAKEAYWNSQSNLWEQIQAFEDWPMEYLLHEPGCSSRFQPYSGIQASHAVTIVADACLQVLNSSVPIGEISMTSWIRGKEFVQQQLHKATRRPWAEVPESLDGILLTRQLNDNKAKNI